MPFAENFSEFAKRQGCPFVWLNEMALFENGARAKGEIHWEPPPDPQTLLQHKIEFVAAKLKQEETKSVQCQNYVVKQSEFHAMGAGPLPDEQAYADLETFQKNVLALRKEFAEKQAELKALNGPTPNDVYLQHRTESQQASHAAVLRARQIQI